MDKYKNIALQNFINQTRKMEIFKNIRLLVMIFFEKELEIYLAKKLMQNIKVEFYQKFI